VAVAYNPLLVAERFGKRLPQTDGDVFDRMVIVNLQVALAAQFQIEQPVPRKQIEQMVPERHARADGDLARPVQV
jgi:hypothetical protein